LLKALVAVLLPLLNPNLHPMEDNSTTLRRRVVGGGVQQPRSSPTSSEPGPLPPPKQVPSNGQPGPGDAGAGPARRFCISAPGRIPWLSRQFPAAVLSCLILGIAVSLFLCPNFCFLASCILTVYCYCWLGRMSICSGIGALKMRRESSKDWTSMLQELQNTDLRARSAMHIVILPNYQEPESMLAQTLENLGRSPLAMQQMNIVLAMEAREGTAGQEKANRLVSAKKHLFADMIVSCHPAGLPGEISGKSSNTQWGLREALKGWKDKLSNVDPSLVFLSVGDADALWHPDYFTALTIGALNMPREQRSWMMWQAPLLLMRNLWSVPSLTRVSSAYPTLYFEVSGLVNQKFGSHIAYSSYSMTMALACHPGVGGFDPDVIAEDHHMFCKCFFASIWESVHHEDEKQQLKPRVRLCPIYLPTVAFLSESSEGWLASCYVRFQQARRHCQGVEELVYVLIQYTQLVLNMGFLRLPFKTHWSILAIANKMFNVHIISPVQSLAAVVSIAVVILRSCSIMWANGPMSFLSQGGAGIFQLFSEAAGGSTQAIFTMLAGAGPTGLMLALSASVIICDMMEGRYYQNLQSVEGSTHENMQPLDPVLSQRPMLSVPTPVFSILGVGSNPVKPEQLGRTLTLWEKIRVGFLIQWELSVFGMIANVFTCLIPEILAAWTLVGRGQAFEYIVASKPEQN